MLTALIRYARRHHLALLALFVALGGTSYAAVSLPHNSVGTAQLKRNAVTSGKVRNGSLKAVDFAPGQIAAGAPGPAGHDGARGRTGATGPRGLTGASGQSTRFFASSGTFRIPAGVVAVIADLRGAGGGGDFSDSGVSGGQGGFLRAELPVVAGDVLTLAVGTGGETPCCNPGPGQDGGDSTVTLHGTVVATAGGGKGGGNPGSGGEGGGTALGGAATGLDRITGDSGSASAPGAGPAGTLGSGAASGSDASIQGLGGYIELQLVEAP